jgi:light-regulated signal transduction histidine kinase (bacteriophytochrome)
MMRSRDDLREEYANSLVCYVGKADQATLHYASELGRRALSNGLGMLDLVLLHHEALGLCVDIGSQHAGRQELVKAAEFLTQSFSSFETSLCGYREENTRLAALNASLEIAKAATEAANRELETFSYSVAHDLRAPLRGIDSFGQALLEDYADKLDDDGKQHLRCEAAQEMAELIDGLLALSRVTRDELRHNPVNLSELAWATVAHLKSAAPSRFIETKVDNELIANDDPRLLRQVLENLLGNAWKFTKHCPRPKIEFGVATQSPQRIYFVRDNGLGFDMTYAASLFEAFQRRHSTGEFEGYGIGLAIVQRIINRHCGRVWAEGEIDRGATFYFTLWDTRP